MEFESIYNNFQYKKMNKEMSSANCQPFCLNLNVLMQHPKLVISVPVWLRFIYKHISDYKVRYDFFHGLFGFYNLQKYCHWSHHIKMAHNLF